MDDTPEFIAGQFRLSGRTVAELRGDVLTKRVRGSVHMLRQPRQSWAIDAQVLVDAERRGARVVEVRDGENGQTYRAGIAMFHLHGFTVDRGYGAQRALALAYWQTSDQVTPPAAVPVQMAFGW